MRRLFGKLCGEWPQDSNAACTAKIARALILTTSNQKSRRPIRTFDWSNLFLACSHCNSNAKRNKFPVDPATESPLLIDPTSDDPLEHLALSPSTGEYVPIGLKGNQASTYLV